MSIINIENFSKSFGSFKAVDNLSLNVESGEIFGFLGRNGAGKTTSIRTLLNIMEPDSGTLHINGERFHPGMSSAIGYLPEERGLYLRATVKDTILYFAQLRGLSKQTASERMAPLMEKLQLKEHENKKIQNLSSGMQQKVQFLITILHQPQLLILDEPFRGLDPVNRQMIYNLLKEEKNKGTTILFSSHQIAEVEDFCDRAIIIADGKTMAYGTIVQIKEPFDPHFIHVRYQGELPEMEEFEWVRQQGNSAEIKFKKEADPQHILNTLVAKVQIQSFEICKPSLHEVFITLCDPENQGEKK
jgi:ABC-2 type transport system ATP-binding protein